MESQKSKIEQIQLEQLEMRMNHEKLNCELEQTKRLNDRLNVLISRLKSRDFNDSFCLSINAVFLIFLIITFYVVFISTADFLTENKIYFQICNDLKCIKINSK